MQFLVADTDPATGATRLRHIDDPGEGPVHLVEGFSLDGLVAPSAAEASTAVDITDFGVQADPGRLSWSVFRQAPGQLYPLHHTDTVDVDTVLAGSTWLTAAGIETELQAGDCVLIAGVPHAWRAGPGGCVLSVAFHGAPRTA
jgi:quercetin dioxygenase-like cupin family protein